MQWNGDKVLAVYEAKFRRSTQAALIHVQNRARDNLSTPSRTVTYTQRFTLGGERGKIKKVLGKRGSSRSLPGGFPHKDRGILRSSIATQMLPASGNGPSGLVGTALGYGKFLELGTVRMAPRPWLRRTLAEQREAVLEIITTV